MSIKYGEITIHHDENDDNIFKQLFRSWTDHEISANENSKIIILFEDGEIFEMKDKLHDYKYSFCDDIVSCIPFHFEKPKDKDKDKDKLRKIYFKKKPFLNDKKQETLKFSDLFGAYKNYSKLASVPSHYNFIYYCHKSLTQKEVFGCIRIKSTETKPRFQFAYDSDEFSKEEIMYLINYILTKKL